MLNVSEYHGTSLLKILNGYGEKGSKSPIRGAEIDALLRSFGCKYDSLSDLIPNSDHHFLIDPSGAKLNLAFKDLLTFIRKNGPFDLTQFGVPYGARVALIFPNGAELAVGIIALLSNWCVLPINYANTLAETTAELRDANITAVIAHYDLLYLQKLSEQVISTSGRELIILSARSDPKTFGLFTITTPLTTHTKVGNISHRNSHGGAFDKDVILPSRSDPPKSDRRHDHALILYTSGTSGKRKLVPYSLSMLIIGVGCIVSAWDLSERDVCLNMMPLFHIGGIVRNILSPLMSGGSVIQCNAFDPVLFWDLIFQSAAVIDTADKYRSSAGKLLCSKGPAFRSVTWYYAAPSMHHAILIEALNRTTPHPISNIRFIANAAGALLPSLVDSLRRTFNKAVILTGYGMTECMPISSPPINASGGAYPTGTSGKPIGPDVIICDDDIVPLPARECGNIYIKGLPCFAGYENDSSANEGSFFTVNGDSGWFNTGDCGYFDENGFLFLTGRSKEIINRGGETISPFEIEEAITLHPFIKECLAFSTPHDTLQETIGVMIVMSNNPTTAYQLDLPTLHEFLTGHLHRNKWPQVIIFSANLPKTLTGKILRIKMAERTKIQELSDSIHISDRLFSATCPPIGAPLSTPIVLYKIDYQDATVLCSELIRKALPALQHFTVMAMKIGTNPNFVVVFYTHGSITPTDVSAILAGKVPIYFMPNMICPVEGLPSNVGEAQEAVTKRNIYLRQVNVTHKEQRCQTETKITRIFASCLGQDPDSIGPDENFFNLGGDSLKAGQLANEIRKAFSPVRFSVAEIFSNPTSHQLADYIKSLSFRHSAMELFPKTNLLLITARVVLPIRDALTTKAASTYSPVVLDSKATAMDIIDTLYSRKIEESFPVFFTRSSKVAAAAFDDDALEKGMKDVCSVNIRDSSSPHKSESWKVYTVQLIPIMLVWPIRKMLSFMLVIYLWWLAISVARLNTALGLFIALNLAGLVKGIFFPLIGVWFKWILLGRCKVGRYYLWSNDYLRWWLADRIASICGMGIYDKVTYMKMLGAQIGSNVKIAGNVEVGVALDVLVIEDNTIIDTNTHVRTITFESEYFLFLPIRIEKDCCICSKCIVVAGSLIPAGAVMGPLSSSYDLHKGGGGGSGDTNNWRHYCTESFRSPPTWMKYCIAQPILLCYKIYSTGPILAGIYLMFALVKLAHLPRNFGTLFDLILWWATPSRIGFYLMLKFIKSAFIPFYQLFFVVCLKRLFIGKFKPRPFPVDNNTNNSPTDTRDDEWYRLKYLIMKKLLPDGTLCGTIHLMGSHYEMVSVVYRLLGAKIGRHVYWPGSGLNIVEHDLLDIGDDVTFGSRSMLLTSSAHHSGPIAFRRGCMIADRCVILPGVVVGEHAVLGSGALACANANFPPGSVSVGSVNGRAVEIDSGDPTMANRPALSPFGKAFYLHETDYFVYPMSFIFAYSLFFVSLAVVWHSFLPVVSAYIAVQFSGTDVGLFIPSAMIVVIVLSPITTFGALAFDVSVKWLVIGRRIAGTYAWDRSSYCQRWQVYLSSQEVRKPIINLFRGTPYLVKYFQYLGCRIGEEVCLYPCGGDPMMTEPDLVTIGAYTVIDEASVIGHINSKGVFKLNELKIGQHCTLKSCSRLLSGAVMEDCSMMLEHTLVMGGETVDADMAWQGWPSSVQIDVAIPYLYNCAIIAQNNSSPVGSAMMANSSSSNNAVAPSPSTNSFIRNTELTTVSMARN